MHAETAAGSGGTSQLNAEPQNASSAETSLVKTVNTEVTTITKTSTEVKRVKSASKNSTLSEDDQGEATKPKDKLTWVEYDPGAASRAAKTVRRHVALASAAARKATMARNDSIAQQRWRQQQPSEYNDGTTTSQRPRRVTRKSRSRNVRKEKSNVSEDAHNGDPPVELAVYVSSLLGGLWSTVDRPAMAHKAIRTLLSGAFTNHTTLFQAAIFMAGTHSNTCGLPPSAIHHEFGTGLILLRGASLEAIQAAVITADGDSMTSVGIALLAGWERRFGDRESYEVHIQAWKALSLPPQALEVNNISRLAELTLESFREGLDERALKSSAASSPGSRSSRARLPPGLPFGFRVFNADRLEALSLLELVARIANHDPHAPGALPDIRKICLENMAWSPSHTQGYEPSAAYEDAWDQEELNALYHVRAACISVNGILLQATLDAHKVSWTMDLQMGLDIHAEACQHLRTEALMGTKYQEVAVWSKFMLCAISRDRSRIEPLRAFLQRQGVKSWEELRGLLGRHMQLELWLSTRFQDLYEHLMGDSKISKPT